MNINNQGWKWWFLFVFFFCLSLCFFVEVFFFLIWMSSNAIFKNNDWNWILKYNSNQLMTDTASWMNWLCFFFFFFSTNSKKKTIQFFWSKKITHFKLIGTQSQIICKSNPLLIAFFFFQRAQFAFMN